MRRRRGRPYTICGCYIERGKSAIKILITVGPTLEPIDPVRFISNRSTGYMGYKIAEEATKRKHVVTLISGPCRITPPKVKKFISIETVKELFSALKREIKNADCLIMCAAVSDFRVKKVFAKKIKRAKSFKIELVPNRDLLEALYKYKKYRIYIGFSLESENTIKNASRKLKTKKLDLIVANTLSKEHNIFGDNKLGVSFIDKSGRVTKIKDKKKPVIAHLLLDKIEEMWYLRDNRGTYAEASACGGGRGTTRK